MTKLKIVFVTRPRQRQMGGKRMRVDQLSKILRTHLPNRRYEISTARVPRLTEASSVKNFLNACKDAVVVFHKSSVVNLDAETQGQLKAVAAGICVDHLDVVVAPLEQGFVDIHITASQKGIAEMKAGLEQLRPGPQTLVRHLRHHADPRLKNSSASDLQTVVPGYFGAANHVADWADLPSDAIAPEYDPTDIGAFLEKMALSNLHFCVRDTKVRSRSGIQATKPFTKGFNAAAVNANVLVNRQVHDAIYYLGSDYPFMIDNHSSSAVNEGLQHARDSFGTSEWALGLERMADMAAQVAPEMVAKEFAEIVDTFR